MGPSVVPATAPTAHFGAALKRGEQGIARLIVIRDNKLTVKGVTFGPIGVFL